VGIFTKADIKFNVAKLFAEAGAQATMPALSSGMAGRSTRTMTTPIFRRLLTD
jgi:hypothetical protein